MSIHHSIVAEFREDVGKGASRRLRRQGKVPAIIYGGHRDPVALTLHQHELMHASEHESFYASIIEIRVSDDLTQQAVVRDMHRHPFKPFIMHVDFMRVSADELLRIAVPIHFVGEEISPAGKTSGVVIQHHMTEVEIEALPKDLPEFLSVDLSAMEVGDSVLLSQIPLPEGVTIPVLESGEGHDTAIANAIHVKESQGSDADMEMAPKVEAEAVVAKPEAEGKNDGKAS
ncbi:MAG TPA: 50S ribosomal protein L25/general stress protein Ctc [Xanthomonadales bacterium]|nr:50S ribosomal protein L25/general stress protein Ctc [Xanthomonadales bacterium]